ncbi:tRNA(Phe) (4-demethylwyosine(37)-C(7)) aminocarboxypropyltransferase [uncultured archaeon]|nr:tRNA(Phe) (4-demethylwyosine(37)-C(7)) aminocarboxypropyltransferase [uncultured archaeon]
MLGLLDKSRKVVERERHVEIPVLLPISGCDVFDQVEPAYYNREPDLKNALQGEMPANLLCLLPRGWYILGDIIVVKIHPALTAYQERIGQALLDFYPRCATVLRDYGIEGQFREPVREAIAGKRTHTLHRENGVVFELDARKVMFSAGNLHERMRMSSFGKDEFVVDMFAGIGYFTLPMAVHSRPHKILAIELNPNAYYYLCRNIMNNHVEEIVEPSFGDCATKTPEGVADRVVMGMVQVTDRYLQKGIKALRPGGILHYHQTIPTWKFPDAGIRDVIAAAETLGRKASIQKCIRVKKYSPGVVHAVIDAQIG